MNRPMQAVTAAIVVCLAFSSVASDNFAKPTERKSPQWLPAPFKLTPDEKASVTKVLEEWEHRSAKFDNYSCDFDCLMYNDAFRKQEVGKGRFCIDKDGRFSIRSEEVERGSESRRTTNKVQWIYNGRQWISAWSNSKEVSRTMLTQDQQAGVRVPFVLRANAKELVALYHIRITKHDQDHHQIFLQFYPRAKSESSILGWLRGQAALPDWRDYEHVDLILSDETYIPLAMQLHQSDYSRTTYIARNPVVNAPDSTGWFEYETPMGWSEIKYPLAAGEATKRSD